MASKDVSAALPEEELPPGVVAVFEDVELLPQSPSVTVTPSLMGTMLEPQSADCAIWTVCWSKS